MVISNNVIDQSNAAATISFTSDIVDLTLTGNLIRGDKLRQGLPFVIIDVRGTIANSTISGNSFIGARAYGINFAENIEYVTISNNNFDDIGTDGGTARSCLRFVKRIDNCCIVGNTFNPREDENNAENTVDAIIAGVTGTTKISGSVILANAYDRSKTFIAKLIDDGNNSIQS